MSHLTVEQALRVLETLEKPRGLGVSFSFDSCERDCTSQCIHVTQTPRPKESLKARICTLAKSLPTGRERFRGKGGGERN